MSAISLTVNKNDTIKSILDRTILGFAIHSADIFGQLAVTNSNQIPLTIGILIGIIILHKIELIFAHLETEGTELFKTCTLLILGVVQTTLTFLLTRVTSAFFVGSSGSDLLKFANLYRMISFLVFAMFISALIGWAFESRKKAQKKQSAEEKEIQKLQSRVQALEERLSRDIPVEKALEKQVVFRNPNKHQ